MKLLILSPFFPYVTVPHAGGRFTYDIIKALSAQHEITLFARIEPYQLKYVNDMKPYCKSIRLYPFKTPERSGLWTVGRILWSYLIFGLKANRLLRRDSFDLIHVEHTQTGIALNIPGDIPSVLLSHDVVTKPAERRYLLSKSLLQKALNRMILTLTKTAEKHISRKFKRVFLLSEKDREVLLGLDSSLYTDVIPYPIEINPIPQKKKHESKLCLFCGAMNRQVNVDAVLYFAEKVFPKVIKEFPDSRFCIVGNNPGSEVKRLAEMNPAITVTGFVEDLSPWFEKASIFVSPLFTGGGIIVKNLMAMSYSLPVVTTTIGNEGIAAENGKEVLVGDTIESFTTHILSLMRDPELSNQIGLAGRRFVVDHYSLETVLDKLNLNYLSLKKTY